MSDRKTIFHIEVENKNTALIWSVLSKNLQFVINRKQHSVDGKDINIYISIDEKKQQITNNHLYNRN